MDENKPQPAPAPVSAPEIDIINNTCPNCSGPTTGGVLCSNCVETGYKDGLHTPPTSPSPAAETVVELHNVWTVYGLNKDGTQVDEPMAELARPQDWGDPERWTYHSYKFEIVINGTRYINHFHGWTDLRLLPWEYPAMFAPLLVQVLLPGCDKEVCGRSHLADDDVWLDAWGPMPPAYEIEGDEG